MTTVTTRPPTFMQRLTGSFKAARSAVLAFTVNSWDEGRAPNYTERHFENYVNEGYKRNELIYTCLTTNAETAASVSLKVYSKGDHEEIEDSPLQALLDRPHPFLSEYDFWALTSIYEDLAGVAYWQKIRNKAGEVIALWPFRPDWMKPIYSSVDFISGYLYCIPGEPEIEIKPRDVLVFKLNWDVLDMRQAISPMGAAARVGDVDNAITDYLKILEERGFQPASVISSKLQLTDEAVDDIIRRLKERYGGLRKSEVPLILDNDASFQKTGMTMTEMDFTALDYRSEARICQVFHIPPIIVGASVGLARSTFANYQEARLSWWEDRLMPKYKHRSDVIDAQLAPEFGDDIETEFDFSKVPALQEKRAMAWTRGLDAFSRGAITRNMFYEEVGLELLPPETGDVFLQGIALSEVPIEGHPEPPPAPAPVQPSNTPPDTQQPPTSVPADEGKAAEPAPVEGKAVPPEPVSRPLSEAIHKPPEPEPDPALIAARIAPHTPAGQLQAVADVLVKREAELQPPAPVEEKAAETSVPVEPPAPSDAEPPKSDEPAPEDKAKAAATLVPPFTQAEIDDYVKLYRQLTGAKVGNA